MQDETLSKEYQNYILHANFNVTQIPLQLIRNTSSRENVRLSGKVKEDKSKPCPFSNKLKLCTGIKKNVNPTSSLLKRADNIFVFSE